MYRCLRIFGIVSRIVWVVEGGIFKNGLEESSSKRLCFGSLGTVVNNNYFKKTAISHINKHFIKKCLSCLNHLMT